MTISLTADKKMFAEKENSNEQLMTDYALCLSDIEKYIELEQYKTLNKEITDCIKVINGADKLFSALCQKSLDKRKKNNKNSKVESVSFLNSKDDIEQIVKNTQKCRVEIYLCGEECISKSIKKKSKRLMEFNFLESTIRKRYERKHPEYVEAKKYFQKTEKQYEMFMKKAMSLYDKQHWQEKYFSWANRGEFFGMTKYQKNRLKFQKKMDLEYRKKFPDYENLQNLIKECKKKR